jgi:putative transposase
MGRRPRRNHSAAFKAKVAIEALAEGKTIAEIAQEHDVHPNQVTEWRRRAAGCTWWRCWTGTAAVCGRNGCRSRWMEADFCVEALREAGARWGAPEIVTTDQGSQFSSAEFIAEVKRIGARQSMDGKGCWRDNVFVERLWRSVKYEDVYLKAYDSVSAARLSLARYFEFYNARRPHQSHHGRTPDMVYFSALPPMQAAA